MLDLLISATVYSLFTAIFISIFIYFGLKKMYPTLIYGAIATVKNEAEIWLNSETGKLAVYNVGGLIGNGAKAGLGIKTGGGKFKIENILGELFGEFVKHKVIPKIQNMPETTVKSAENLDIPFKSKFT